MSFSLIKWKKKQQHLIEFDLNSLPSQIKIMKDKVPLN